MPEELLDRPQVGAALEQVRGEGVTQQVGMHAPGLEAGALGETAQDEERAGTGKGATAGVEEEVGAMPPVEVRASERQVAT